MGRHVFLVNVSRTDTAAIEVPVWADSSSQAQRIAIEDMVRVRRATPSELMALARKDAKFLGEAPTNEGQQA